MKFNGFLRNMSAAFLAATIVFVVCAHAVDTQTILYSFAKPSGGYYGSGNLLMDKAGNLYGATTQGGINTACLNYGCGTIFEMSPKSGGGWTYTVLHEFTDIQHDSVPNGSLVMDAAGNLYGSTSGFYGPGDIFELSPNGSGAWSETVLYVLGTNDGLLPWPVVFDPAGNLFGTTWDGGASNRGYVFELSPQSGGGWTFQHLHDFSGSDGWGPVGGVTVDASGNLFGATYWGGNSTNCSSGCGVVFELKKGTGTWTEKTLHQFTGSNGSNPSAALVIDAAGNLYGSAQSGGAKGFGLVFELTPVSGGWKAHTLHTFTDANGDGAVPNTALVLDAAGNLYGTTDSGGAGLNGCVAGSATGCGSAFELSPSASGWKQTILHDFTGLRDGAFPQGVILDSNGNLFGSVTGGGNHGVGMVYELSP